MISTGRTGWKEHPMNFFRLLPVILSFLVLAAHFSRAGSLTLSAACIIFPAVLLIKKPMVPMVMQTALLLGAVEWVRTLILIVQMRMEFGQPWTRLAIILGVVALFTGLSALVFQSKALRMRYR
jgi:hypothetical protein